MTRNTVGVQLLSRVLHQQIFRDELPRSSQNNVLTVTQEVMTIAKEHLAAHGLDTSQASKLPNIGWTLPPLQGRNLGEHFYRLGMASVDPWLGFAKEMAKVDAPPVPKREDWSKEPGWTKYSYLPDGSIHRERVDAPDEEMLTLDVETLPRQSPYAIMACAMSAKHWYSWVSPWLAGEDENLEQLIPLGDPSMKRIIVGHNVSYDRSRILEEYNLKTTGTRFLDTMSLHVAVKGISSHQRPAWMKHRKAKKEAKAKREEAIQALEELILELEEQQQTESDDVKRVRLQKLRRDFEDSLPQLASESEEAEASEKRWEDITSTNALAEVARLYCDIEVDKEVRKNFMVLNREEIYGDLETYLDYCANDVAVTHAVYRQVLPGFLISCPHPVSFAGILTMGSGFLPVNESWIEYCNNAEAKYKEMEKKVTDKLIALAEEARTLMENGDWKNDVWLSQLDWEPKAPGKSRGVEVAPKVPEVR